MTSRDNNQAHIPSRLAISIAAATAPLAGYGGRKAYTASNGGSNNYTCTATETNTQTLSGTPLQVSTSAGFSVETGAGDAFTLTGMSGLTFPDCNASTTIGRDIESLVC